jgi:hypothetical protein
LPQLDGEAQAHGATTDDGDVRVPGFDGCRLFVHNFILAVRHRIIRC